MGGGVVLLPPPKKKKYEIGLANSTPPPQVTLDASNGVAASSK